MIKVFPSELAGKVDPLLYTRLIEIYNLIYNLSDQVGSKQITVLDQKILLQIRNSLQAKGPAQMNVQGLLGVLAQAQVGGAPSFETFPVPADPRSQEGALGVLAGDLTTLYRYDQTTRTWLAVAAIGVVSVEDGGSAVGQRAVLNFIEGDDITLTIADNPGNSRIDITISITGSTGWGAASGTVSRAAYASYAGQTVSNPPTQAEVQQIDDALKLLSQTVSALITDLTTQKILRA